MRRQQKCSTYWCYIGLCALLVYLISFGSFMSRIISLDLLSDPYSTVSSVDLAADSHRSTREYVQTASTSRGSLRSGTPYFHKSTQNPVLSPIDKSLIPSSLDSDLGIPEQHRKPETSRRISNASGPEVDEQPEVKLLRLFKLQRNSSGVAKPDQMEGALRLLGGSTDTNLTDSQTGNTSSDGDVVNPHPFHYLLNCETICQRTPALFLLVYVHTAPSHYKRRMIIRQTWGNVEQYSVAIRVVFFTGSPDSVGVQRALQFEAEQYGDVVQEDFLDTYRNLTYKGIAALKWISEFCPNARFILKSDDDIFVSMFTLIRHLELIQRKPGEISEVRDLLLCLVWNGMPVMRSGKWMVSKEEWKEDTYPTYCSGSAFVMSTDVAIALHNVSYHVPFFWVDDFYVTGLLPLKLGTVKHTQFMSTYLLNGNALEEKFTGSQWYKYIFSHVHNLDAIQTVWRKVVALFKGELVPTIQYLVPKNTTDTPKPH